MLLKRIIPTLLINNNKLIHRSSFDQTTDIYVGDPINTINIFNHYEVDEMMIVDVSNKDDQSFDYDFLKALSGEAFFPLSYSGGIKNPDNAKKIISSGFEKIVVNSLLINNPNLVLKIINEIGSQSVVASINIYSKKNNYFIYDHKNKKIINIIFEKFIDNVLALNTGEIFFTHVNLDGNMHGFDSKLVQILNKLIDKPIIFKGGCENYEDLKKLFEYNISAVSSSSVFIMKKKNGGVVINYPNYEEKIKIYGNM
jgi:cyclase